MAQCGCAPTRGRQWRHLSDSISRANASIPSACTLVSSSSANCRSARHISGWTWMSTPFVPWRLFAAAGRDDAGIRVVGSAAVVAATVNGCGQVNPWFGHGG